MGDETKPSTVTVALLVLASCHAALALSNVSAPHDDDDPAAPRGVEPVGYLFSMASTVIAAYVASAACGGGRGRRQQRLHLEQLLAEARRTWARPVATALYIELLTTAMVTLLLTLRAFLGAASTGAAGAAVGLLTASGSVALVGWLTPVLFAHSDIACRMSLVIAVAEGYAGRAAVHRAEALVAGRGRKRGFAVGLVAAAIEQVPAWLCGGGGGAPAMVFGLVVLAAKIAACCACAAFYYDCRRRQDRIGDDGGAGALKLEGMWKCCEIDALDMAADECEAAEFWSALACFRLT